MMSTMRAMRRIFAGLLALLMVLGAAPAGWAGSSSPPPPAGAPGPGRPRGRGRRPGDHAAARQLHPRRGLLLAAGRRRLGPRRAQHAPGPGRRALCGAGGQRGDPDRPARLRARRLRRPARPRQPGARLHPAPRHVGLCRARPARARARPHGGARYARRGLHGGARRVLPRRGQAGHDRVPDLSRRQRGHDAVRRRRDTGGGESAGGHHRRRCRRASRRRRRPR